MAGVAHGFGVKVVRHPDLERRLRDRHGAAINEARLRMAEVPEGVELIGDWSMYGPVPKMRNVYIFAGIPKVLQDRFGAIKERFREAPYYLKVIYSREGEGVVASILNKLLVEFPELLLGSYPVLDNPDYRVKLTLESKDSAYLERAFARLVDAMPKDSILRTEG